MPNSVWRESLNKSILDLVENKTNIGSWSWDLETGEVSWSLGVYRIFDIPPGEAAQINLLFERLESGTQIVTANPNRLIVAKLLADRRFQIRRQDGEVRSVHSHGKLVDSPTGRQSHFVGAFLDVTESNVSDELFVLREALIESMRNLFGVVIWQTDADGSVSDMLQWRMAVGDDAGGDHPWGRLEIVHPDDRTSVRQAWVEAQRNRQTYAASFRMLRRGKWVRACSRAVALLDGNGALRGWMGFTKRLDEQPPEALTPQSEQTNLTPSQIRAARAYLGWSMKDLAQHAGVSFSTVRRVEQPKPDRVSTVAITALRSALASAGIDFFEHAGQGVGIGERLDNSS